MDSVGFDIIDQHDEKWPTLAGVFKRVFPVAVGNARYSGLTQTVWYHGEQFEIRPRNKTPQP